MGTSRNMPMHAAEDEFRPHTRDLYIPAGDIGMWQGAIRHPEDPLRAAIAEAIDELGTDLIGRRLMDEHDGWPAYAKFFDNQGALPFHVHPDDAPGHGAGALEPE